MAKKKKGESSESAPMKGGDAVYGVGMIGAWVYFWKTSDTAGDKAAGLLKGLVWPAFLVYEAFSAVSGRPSQDA